MAKPEDSEQAVSEEREVTITMIAFLGFSVGCILSVAWIGYSITALRLQAAQLEALEDMRNAAMRAHANDLRRNALSAHDAQNQMEALLNSPPSPQSILSGADQYRLW